MNTLEVSYVTAVVLAVVVLILLLVAYSYGRSVGRDDSMKNYISKLSSNGDLIDIVQHTVIPAMERATGSMKLATDAMSKSMIIFPRRASSNRADDNIRRYEESTRNAPPDERA